MRSSDWSSVVCSSELLGLEPRDRRHVRPRAPFGFGESHVVDDQAGAERQDVELEVAVDREIASGRLLHLRGDQALVLIEVHVLDDDHPSHDQGYHQKGGDLQDCANAHNGSLQRLSRAAGISPKRWSTSRSGEHTSELQHLLSTSNAASFLNKKKKQTKTQHTPAHL